MKKKKKKKEKEKKEEKGEDKEGEEAKEEKKDPKSKKAKDKKSNGSDLIIHQPIKGFEHKFEEVTDYVFSKKGDKIAFIATKNDSLERTEISVFDTKKQETKVIFKAAFIENLENFVKNLSFFNMVCFCKKMLRFKLKGIK